MLLFSDDPLRMMRAVRFAAQLGFLLKKILWNPFIRIRTDLKSCQLNGLKKNYLRFLACPQPSIGLGLMFHTHLLDLVLPEVAKLDGVEEIYGHQHKNNLVLLLRW